MQNHTVKELNEDEIQGTVVEPKAWNSEQLKSKLTGLFENEKIYRDPNLKITNVTSRLNTNRTYISKLINNEFQETFNEFVNRYRVEEVKNLFKADKEQQYTLNFIYETAGFGSLSSFIRIFKAMTGKTPGQYRNSIK